jgi:hypothetical protein
MKTRRKQQSRNYKPRHVRSVLYFVLASAVLVLAVVSWWSYQGEVKEQNSTITKQPVPPPYGDVQHQLAMQFLGQLTEKANPALPENAYMPPGLRSRLEWVYSENHAGRLKLYCAKWLEDSNGNVVPNTGLMGGNYEDGIPIIAVMGPKLYQAVFENGGRIPAMSQEWKNYFAAGLAHEVIHLENREFFNIPNPTDEQHMTEELRTWTITSKEVVQPLRAMGQPVGPDLTKADDFLQRCNYQLPCEGLRAFLKTMG